MALFDLLGRRWTLRVLWELREGPLGFRALQERCGRISPTSLSRRLDELREAGVVEDSPAGLHLSAEGRALIESLLPLQRWADRWARRARQR